MDNAMVKRGIGAIVLAIIAALLLGWLLKDKSSQRQEVVEMNIPSLTESIEAETGTATLLNEGKSMFNSAADSMKNTGAAVIDSAKGLTNKATDKVIETTGSVVDTAKNTASDASSNLSAMKPGFAIRPSLKNEEKEIIDNTNYISQTTQENSPEKQQEITNNVVVASASNTIEKVKKAFKPQIIEKKKAKPKPKKTAVASSTAKKKTAPTEAAKITNVSATPTGKYSIQLLATSSQSRANKLATTMKGEGYTVFVTQTTRNDKILFRVRIGGHGNRNAAIKAQEGMKKRYRKNFFVQNSLVISN